MLLFGSASQVKGLGSSLASATKRLMAACKPTTAFGKADGNPIRDSSVRFDPLAQVTFPRRLEIRYRRLTARRVAAIMRVLRHPRRDRPEPPAIFRRCAHRIQWIVELYSARRLFTFSWGLTWRNVNCGLGRRKILPSLRLIQNPERRSRRFRK